MKKIFRFFWIFPLLILGSHTVFANMAAPVLGPFHYFLLILINIFIVFVISVLESLIIKFGVKIKYLRSLWTVFLANIITAIIGILFFKTFLINFHSNMINPELFLEIVVIYFITVLIEFGLLSLLLKDVPGKKLFPYVFLANLVSYLLLILSINIYYKI